MRSGTSMMMDCLSAGGRVNGLKCEWSRERDMRMNAANADDEFIPNESYREIDLREYNAIDFPLKYDGSLIKVMNWGLPQMRRTNGFRCVFMLRDAYEIAESYERSFGSPLMTQADGIRLPALECSIWGQQYIQDMKRSIITAETRIDCVSFHVMDYAEAIKNPLEAFCRLSNSGWDIDPEVAASQVLSERQRVSCLPH